MEKEYHVGQKLYWKSKKEDEQAYAKRLAAIDCEIQVEILKMKKDGE